MDLDKELTKKFLSGEMSFAEYSSEWYDDEEEDVEELIERSDNEPTTSTSVADKSVQRRGRRLTRLSPVLLGLMGEANLRFARGDVEMAEKMCHEVIKQVPTASEPYQTLSQIYENDKAKHLQFSLLAAHLSPSDVHEWLRLATLCQEVDDLRQEMICYTRAIRAQPENLELHLKRIEAVNKLENREKSNDRKVGDKKCLSLGISRVKCYHMIVQYINASDGDEIMKYARLAATEYHNNNEIDKAVEVLTLAYNKCGALFTLEDLNIFLELLITQKQYQNSLEVLVCRAGVEIEAEILTVKNGTDIIEEQTHYTKCTIPNNLPIDLKSKLLICFINLGAIDLVKKLMDEFLAYDVEKAGDLFMDIEEALSSAGYCELALKMLEPLINNTSFDLGAVWLKHANCLMNLGKEEEAVSSYYKVLKHAPQHPEARKKLFNILEKNGKIDEALDIMQQNYKYVVSASLLYEQCCILKKYNKMDKYLEVGEALLSKTFGRYRHEEELNIAFRVRTGTDVIQSFRTIRGENPFNENDLHFDEEEEFKLSPQQEWDLFIDLLRVAWEQKKYVVMQRLSFGAVISKNLSSHRSEIEFYCFQSALINNDYPRAFRFIREIASKIQGPRIWNILNFLVNSMEETTYWKFLHRFFKRFTEYDIKKCFFGNNFLTSGRYLVGLKNFLEYHEDHENPLTALLIAITILAMASLRTVDKHHNLILQGMAYLLNYKKLRQFDQEAYYNMGRACQMLRINNLAIEYYERALNSPIVAKCEKHGEMNLIQETAYNLYLLYKDHSPQMARKYMLKYLVIE